MSSRVRRGALTGFAMREKAKFCYAPVVELTGDVMNAMDSPHEGGAVRSAMEPVVAKVSGEEHEHETHPITFQRMSEGEIFVDPLVGHSSDEYKAEPLAEHGGPHFDELLHQTVREI